MDELTNGGCVLGCHDCHGDRGCRHQTERGEQPWPRASGPFSRTTAAGPVCTVSGCVCVRAPAAPSCRAVAARAVARSLRDSTQGSPAVLPARYRMTRSTDFGVTVRHGVRAVQPDIVVHALHDGSSDGRASASDEGPKIGLVVSKSVGTAVQRHRVSRRLRHVAYHLITDSDSDLGPSDRVVIRALPGSRDALSARLESELRSALKKTRLQRRARP